MFRARLGEDVREVPGVEKYHCGEELYISYGRNWFVNKDDEGFDEEADGAERLGRIEKDRLSLDDGYDEQPDATRERFFCWLTESIIGWLVPESFPWVNSTILI